MKINEFFKKGFYINLDRRPDRREEFENEMNMYGLNTFFERISAEDSINEPDPIKKHAYCALTYYKLFERIYNEGYDMVLIFEDDAYFYNDDKNKGMDLIEKSLDDLSSFPDWQMIYFGGHPIREVDIVSKTLMKAPTILTTHAVGYKRSVIKRILDEYNVFVDCAIDGWLGQRHDIIKYLIHPIAVPQRETKSDLDASGNGVGVQIFKSSYDVVKKNYIIIEKNVDNINK
jgi:hypothetical protein